MAVIVKGDNMPKNCQYCRHNKPSRYGDFYCHMDLGETPRNMKDCPLKSVDGLIEQIIEEYGHSTSLDGIIDVIKEYCEVSDNDKGET